MEKKFGRARTDDTFVNHQTTLHQATTTGQIELVKTLLGKSAKVNVCDALGRTPLYNAALEGHVEIVKLLLKNGATIDAQDEIYGNTALHVSAWQGYSQLVEVLCKAKANMYVKNRGGFSPLHMACQNGHNQSCRLLLWAGCKPDLKNNYGDTPLHTAARYGHAGVIRILKSALCNINEVNKNGDTVLHIAAAMNWRKLTKIILESGCDHSLKNHQNESALDIAVRKEHKEIITLLSNAPPVIKALVPKTTKSEKRPDKDSGTSLGDNDLGVRGLRKNLRSSRVKFALDTKKDNCSNKHSPYGCPLGPITAAFPPPRLDTLPSDPLSDGEQYYIDLAGSIKKGAVGVGCTCFCGPQFQEIKSTMETNKKDVLDKIHHKCKNLRSRINNLEKRTCRDMTCLSQELEKKFDSERTECLSRLEKRVLKERREIEKMLAAEDDIIRDDHRSYKSHDNYLRRNSSSQDISEPRFRITRAKSDIIPVEKQCSAKVFL